MKNSSLIKNFFASALLLIGFGAFGQNFVLQNMTDSLTNSGCGLEFVINMAAMENNGASNSDLDITLIGTNYANSPFTTTVYWGDGTTTTHQGQSTGIGANIQFNPPIVHNYANAGSYYLIIDVVNISNNSTATLTVPITVMLCNTQVYNYSTVICTTVDPSILINGVPYNFVDSSGNSTVVWVLNGAPTMTSLAAGIYTISVWAPWMQANGIINLNASPMTYTINATSNAITLQSIFDCDSNLVDNCLNGFVFCDLNQDGYMDPNESGTLGNAVVDITVNGNVQTVTTDPNGYFNFVYTGIGFGGTINANQAWLNSMGYSSLGSQIFTSDVPCDFNGYNLNLPINCDSTSSNNMCVSGTLFCDQNGNGQLDPNEAPIPYSPVIIYADDSTIVMNTDASGNYSYSYSITNDPYVSVYYDQTWLTQNGMTSNYQMWDANSIACANGGQTMDIPIICDSIAPTTACIGGWVFCDLNNNGTLNTTESGNANIPVTITGSNNVTVTVYTNSNGTFFYSGNDLGTGFAVVSVDQSWLLQNNYTFNSNLIQTVSVDCNDTLPPLYFPVTCPGTTLCADLWSNVTPWIGYYQNQTNSVQMTYGNSGPAAAQSYTLTLTFPANATPVLSSINNPNYTITGNVITWTLTSYSPYFSASDVIYFNVPGGQTNGTANTFSTSIVATGNNGDCNSNNNTGTLTMLLGNSYDPNDKTVDLPEMISPDVQDELTYLVRFQNTGTAPAQDIFIIDTLSSNLDWSTFALLDASHNVQVINLGNGVMKFNFPNIWLPDSTTNLEASQGSFTYKISENVGNGIGTEIENTAYIYFDWNPAIVTNTTYNQNNILSVDKLEANKIDVYPNPFGDVLNIRSDENVSAVRIYDLTGKLIISKNGTSIQTISTVDLKTGVYLVELTAGNQTSTKRVIKK